MMHLSTRNRTLLLAPMIALAASMILPFIARSDYQPSPEVIESRKAFNNDRFGIFIHWGIYSMFAQGEWYLNSGISADEYSKAATGFYPSLFNADEWVDAIKGSGARYICFTSRHHDGFSMFKTQTSDYNIVDGTPFGRDIVGELADACHAKDISLHLYYSHLDWMRDDYPVGRTGLTTGRELRPDWEKYYSFMNTQLSELLTNYGPIRAIWFDGWWDHDSDSIPFNWELEKQYELVHSLQPGCLVGNNHHQTPFEGEDIQIFERDVPGENNAGYSGQDISVLPLETCQTMNGMWGYKIEDTDYKDSRELIQLIVRTAGKGANLLLNIGPQPNGQLPATALSRLKEIGDWMGRYGETIYGTEGAPFEPLEWGTATVKDNRIFVHLLAADSKDIRIPLACEINDAKVYGSDSKVRFTKDNDGIILHLDEIPVDIDYIVELAR